MKRIVVLSLMLLICTPLLAAETAPGVIHHHIEVSINPKQHRIDVIDKITFPNSVNSLTLHLHSGLNPHFLSNFGEVSAIKISEDKRQQRYQINLPANSNQLQIEYAGSIHHALSSSRAEQSRGFRRSAGLIDNQGVFLSASSLWFPQFDGFPYLTYSLQLDLPSGWSAITQGNRLQHLDDNNRTREHWSIDKPQEEIYLVAAPFIEYQRNIASHQNKPLLAQVFLRKSNPALADRYLDATVKYLSMYEQLLGPYPYSKFALVENFWETGYGMPSFTLLGSRVIRLPFILHTSYPHEILHNWWGNGVYIDFSGGNWSEGLTAYLADHLIKELQGQGSNYRMQSLQKYRDYAAKQRDLPLSQFTGRHSSASEAVGYGKSLMLFHMLRKQIGNENFISALRKLYRDYQFQNASFDDIRQVFEQVSGQTLTDFFSQWVERTGAPQLVLSTADVKQQPTGTYRLALTLRQTQVDAPYELSIPVTVSLGRQNMAQEYVLHMTRKLQSFELELPAEPTRLDIDPDFDLFRMLAQAETPPAFTELFGAKDLLVVFPGDTQEKLKSAWREFAEDIAHMGPERVRLIQDDQLESLPSDGAVLILGWNNRFSGALQSELARHSLVFAENEVQISKESTARNNHSFAWITRHQGSKGESYPWAFITTDIAGALPGLARKIPHYHKYSYLAFSGSNPDNRTKGRWPVKQSPMSKLFVDNAERMQLEPSPSLLKPM